MALQFVKSHFGCHVSIPVGMLTVRKEESYYTSFGSSVGAALMEAQLHSSSFGARDCIGDWQQLCNLGLNFEIVIVFLKYILY